MTHAFSPSNIRRFDADSHLALAGIGWQGRLDQSSDVHEVLDVVKEHIALLAPEEIAELPKDLWPGKIVDANDVANYAVQLARYQHLRPSGPVLDKLAVFMTNASQRLSQLLAHG